ncbi:MAG TPA: hypothetical protein VGL77_17160 [Armatimonadota bacterium]|jgi:hypothetical protein
MTREKRWALWTQHVSNQQVSGASAAAWYAQFAVPLPAFYVWRQRVLGKVYVP